VSSPRLNRFLMYVAAIIVAFFAGFGSAIWAFLHSGGFK
jgi:hypothetical protein